MASRFGLILSLGIGIRFIKHIELEFQMNVSLIGTFILLLLSQIRDGKCLYMYLILSSGMGLFQY